MLRRLVLPLLLLLLAPAALLAVDADLIVPVTGTTPGAMGSSWQGELALHNSGKQVATIHLTLYGAAGQIEVRNVVLQPGATMSFDNVVSDLFALTNATGALAINYDDAANGTIAVTSRVLNHTASGEFGQDVPAIAAADTVRAGSTGVILGPPDVATSRFNFGIFTVDASTIEWRLLRADGSLAATVTKEYEAGRHEQYNAGVAALFNAAPENDDTIHARVVSGNAVVYGSIVANSTGDPTFVPGFKVRELFAITLLGVDVDENGSVDILDADNDGTLDAPVILYSGFLPNYFRVVTKAPEGSTVALSIVEAPRDTEVIDNDNGTILSYPGVQYKGTTSRIVVRASDSFATADLVIPVIIR